MYVRQAKSQWSLKQQVTDFLLQAVIAQHCGIWTPCWCLNQPLYCDFSSTSVVVCDSPYLAVVN